MRSWVIASLLLFGRLAAAQPVQEISPDEPIPVTGPPGPTPTPEPAPPPPTPAPAPAPTPAPTPTPTEPAHVHTMDELSVPQSTLRFVINFFGDTSASVMSSSPHTAFTLGALGIRMLGTLSPSVDALAEFAIETTQDGPIADVEQVALRWRYGPGTLTIGRSHTDLGFWNTAYHHGLWLQTPISRPHALRFEDDGGLAPVHWMGAHYMLQGSVGDGNGALVVGIANGRGTIVDDIRVLDEVNEGKAALLKGRLRTSMFEVGATVIYDQIASAPVTVRPALPNRRIDEVIANAYFALRTESTILIAEGYMFAHTASTDSWLTFAGYGLFGQAITSWLMPYAAIDVVRGAEEDPFFSPDPMTPAADLIEVIGGIRFDVSAWSAIKVEFRGTSVSGEPDLGLAGVANWSFGL